MFGGFFKKKRDMIINPHTLTTSYDDWQKPSPSEVFKMLELISLNNNIDINEIPELILSNPRKITEWVKDYDKGFSSKSTIRYSEWVTLVFLATKIPIMKQISQEQFMNSVITGVEYKLPEVDLDMTNPCDVTFVALRASGDVNQIHSMFTKNITRTSNFTSEKKQEIEVFYQEILKILKA